MWLLDSDLCIGFLRGQRDAIQWVQSHSHDDLAVCSVVRGELMVGAWKARHVSNFEVLEKFLAGLPSFPFDDKAADEYGRLRARLEIEGQMIGSNDLMIASIAMANNCAVVTRNIDEFRRVPALLVETW